MDMPGGTKKPYAINLFMGTDFVDHFVDFQTIVFQHLKVRRVQNDFTNGFNIVFGVLQENFFESADIEKGKERDRDQQYDTGSEDVLADQTFAKGPEHVYHTRFLPDKKAGCRE